MSFREVFQGSVELIESKKKLKMHSPAYFSTKISKLPVGKKVWVMIDDRAPTRSDQQNRLYWRYLEYIHEETGNEKDDLHEYFANKYLALPESILTLADGTKQVIRRRRSTADLTKDEFSYYLNRIELESGVKIPDTEAYLYGKREEQIDTYNKVMESYPDPEDFKAPTI